MSPVPTESNVNPNDARSASDPTTGTRQRTWLFEAILGSAMLVLLFLIDRLRPRRQVESANESLAVRTNAAPASSGQPRDQPASATTSEHPSSPAEYEMTSSIWPAVVGAGITLTAFGVVTNVTFSIFGALVFIGGVSGWVGELIRE